MRIGYFIDMFPYQNPITGKILKQSSPGGAGIVAYNLAVQMAKRGHEVYVFTTAQNEDGSLSRYGNISVIRYKSNFTVGQGSIALKHLIRPFFSSVDLDIVHSHAGGLPAPLGGAIYAKRKNIPFVITHHAEWIGGFGTFRRRAGVFLYNNLICDWLLSKSDINIAPSKSFVDVSENLKKYRDKIVIIPNGLNLQEFQIPQSKGECRDILNLPMEKKILLYMGSLHPHKGPNVLITAMAHVVKQHPNTLLLIGGKGIIEEDLKRLTEELNLQNNVKFLGFVTSKSKALYYKASDLFVLPSLTESFGIVNLEAMASGLPVVASSVGGVPDVVKDGINGLLTIPRDPDDLAEKISCLCDSESLRDRLGKTGEILSKEYSWETVSDKTESVYLDLI
ncbi:MULTISPECIES: glycosyltransferase family 4 protein [unclassified Methanoculleus]|uniref:glycosyltransferase family 4 protein n=1 Tax=unclassified Methanoculleus TaxID=2619537 RepID=UPI0025ECCF43|nr:MULTISPECIES: glycosyltransferase family 4 protein [unclassified Methanoculleus]MCK9297336.1 glycosyltransferase family 4 protein [Methanoculleus sp.]MDD2254047.1 glycosyltransferase family 4 protein [Methanoculleus sp.]MDD2786605.1 glycosyltransferase family 4 protein [Methanoculleus sp.]MDD3216448.1 glycosyltransferase family 4 protein [Methanoculleus sp.]MDD4313356.1 glycosyltransferase family 4 protein [Methanoculleus sp.]